MFAEKLRNYSHTQAETHLERLVLLGEYLEGLVPLPDLPLQHLLLRGAGPDLLGHATQAQLRLGQLFLELGNLKSVFSTFYSERLLKQHCVKGFEACFKRSTGFHSRFETCLG